MRRAARLHRHQTPRQFGEESDKPAPRELARNDDFAPRVDAVNLKRVLRQIDPDTRDSGEIPDRLASSSFNTVATRGRTWAPATGRRRLSKIIFHSGA